MIDGTAVSFAFFPTGENKYSVARHCLDPGMEATMTHIYFQCSNADGLVLFDKRGADVADMIEAHHIATQIVREFVNSHGPYDWRTWTLHVSDEDGQELFLMPFSVMLGRPH